MDKNTVKTSFGKYVNAINLKHLAEPIHEVDRYKKKCTFESYLHFMIYAHLNEVNSLRALEDELINKDLQAHLGFETLSVSQLSRKHRGTDADILAAIFADLCQNGYTFLTRIKKNTVVTEVETREVKTSSVVETDRVVRLGAFQQVMHHKMRVIEVRDTQDNLLRLMTNDMEAPAETLAEMYRNRWQIELFFRWIKQHVTIKRFFSFDEEAAQNQIYIALITFCLLVLHRQETSSRYSPLKVARRLEALIWQPYQEWVDSIRGLP